MPNTESQHAVYHFTHWSHLPDIVQRGLLSDSTVRASSAFAYEAGDRTIKERRRQRVVPCEPGGVVADYVPFYLAPRSPMLYRIANPRNRPDGGVATYGGSSTELVYLVSSVERLHSAGLALVLSDRNAATTLAEFRAEATTWFEPGFIDWQLMAAQYWSNTATYPDRMERRMAECLVHRRVPWLLFTRVAVANTAVAQKVRDALARAGEHTITPVLEPGW